MWTAVQQKSPSSYFSVKIRERLSEAASISVAAEACANAGQVDKAVRVAMSFEQLAYEANGLLEAATLLTRLSKSQKNVVE